MGNNFILQLIAGLSKTKSKQQIKLDVKNLDDIKIPLVGTLNKAKTRAQIKQDLASMNGTINLTGKFNQKGVVTSVQQATQQAQKAASRNSIQVSMSVKKDKLINDIKVFGQQNTKLFKDANMSAKYNSLLDNAKLATSGKELQNLRLQLSAMRSEVKATNLSGLTLGDTFKKTFKRATELFTGTAGVMVLSHQLREAWTQALELDKAYTDLIKVQSELTRGDYPEYLEQCNKKAQELATTQKSLIEGATEFSKSGYTKTQSDQLAEKSTILSNVGDMSATDSAKAIISGVQAYDVVDGYDDVIDKAGALIDKYNEIGNTASITTAEIAQGVQTVGSIFSDANTSVDQFIALLSAGNRQFQDADTLALGLRTAALRIRGCEAQLEQLGETTDGVYTSASKLAAKIEGLTDIDGKGGVQILEADGETFRSIYDIFVDISKVYQQMSDTDQSALLDLIAGKNRASAVSATLNNMTEAQEIYERSLNSAGSAQKEYDTYLGSSEASLNRFKSTMTETYQSVISGQTVTALLNCGNATLQFVNNLGLVESTLKGLVAIGIVKAITTLSTAFKASAISVSNFGTALNTVKNMSSMANGTTEYKNALQTLKTVSAELSETQLKQVLSNKALSDSDKVAILRTTGLTKAQAQAKLAQMGLTQAQTTATASTFSLTAAVKGLGVSLKAAFMSNPIGITIMAVSTAVGAISSAISIANQKVDEMRQKVKEAAQIASDTIKSASDELDNLKSNAESAIKVYDRLLSGVDSLTNKNISLSSDDYKEFLNTNNQLADLFPELVIGLDNSGNAILDLGDDAGSATQKLNDLVEAQRQALAETTKENMPDVFKGLYEQTREARKELDDYKKSISNTDASLLITDIIGAAGQAGAKNISLSDTYRNGIDSQQVINQIASLLNKELGTNLKAEYNDLTNEYYLDLVNMTDEQYQEALSVLYQNSDDLVNNLVTQYTQAEQKSRDEINKAYRDNVQDILSTLSLDSEYSKLNESTQNMIQMMISNFDYSSYADEIKKNYNNDIYAFFQDEFLNSFYDSGNRSKILKAYNDILSLDPENTYQENQEKIDEYVDDIVQLLNNKFSAEQIKIMLGIEVDGTAVDKVQSQVRDMAASLSFSEAWSQLQSATDESTKDLSDDLLELAKAGQLTEDAFKAKDTTNYFDELGISAQKAVEEINKLVDESDQLSSMSSQISKMSDALATKQSEGYVSADTLSGFDAEVRGLDSWDEFQDKVGSSTSSLEECKQAASALATEWVNSKNFLSQLNDSNVDYYDTQLMLMGVENHREIVTEALAQKTQLLAAEELYEQKITSTTSENSAKTINNMIEQGKVTDDAARALAAYTLQAQYCNDNAIFTNGSCNNLLDLAHVAGVTGEALQQLQTLIQLLNSGQIMAKTRITNIQNRIKEILNDNYKKNYSIGVGVNVSTAGSGGGKSGSGSSGSGSSETDTSKEYDWIAIGIQRCQEAITRLNKVEENTYDDWSNRNQALIGEINQITKEIDLLQRSYQGYMDAANSIRLSEEYKQKVQNGTIQIETITDKNLQEQIDNYQDLYNKAINCSDQIQELNIQLSDLAKQRFDNVVKQFEELEGVFTSLNDIINAQIDYVEARGRLVSKSYYEAMLRNENENNKLLVQQRDAMIASLNDAVNSGRIEEGSESWHDLTKQISEANKAIVESNKSIVEFSNNIRQADWDLFDLVQDKITGIADEIEFVQSLLDDRDNLTDGYLNRGLTNEGIAQLGNYASKYNIYMSQAEKYANEIKKIEADIAKDPANQDLINRKEELIKAQRDVILSANDEKKSMIDLARNGYDAILDVLQELIDKKKEQLSAEKELYDYQKSIQEKSDNIANIKKQLSVFENDNSEEALKKVQQLRSDLNDAESDLQDAEYEKYISDQENMLDQFYQEYSDKIDEKFEQTEILIQELIGVVNENQSSISNTITTVTSDVGYTISDQMKTIWNDAGTVISGFTGKFDTYATTVQSAINSIQVTIDKMLQIAQAEANKSIAESSSGNVSGIGSSGGSSGFTPSGNSSSPIPQASTSVPPQPQASVGTRISAASGRWYYDSYGTAPTGDVNRFHPDYFEIDRIVQGRAYPYHIQAYIRGKRAGGNGWVKGNQIGYKNGLKEATYDHLAWTQEDGTEMIRTKDGALLTPITRGTTVFTREMTDNLWNIAQQNPEKFYQNVMPAMNTFATTNRSGDVTVSIGDIRLDGIQNPEQFAHQLINVVQNNSRVQKTLQAGTVDLLNGQSAKRINRF